MAHRPSFAETCFISSFCFCVYDILAPCQVVSSPAAWISPQSFEKFRISDLAPDIMNQNLHFNEIPKWFMYTIQSTCTAMVCLIIVCVHIPPTTSPRQMVNSLRAENICHIYLWFLTVHEERNIIVFESKWINGLGKLDSHTSWSSSHPFLSFPSLFYFQSLPKA